MQGQNKGYNDAANSLSWISYFAARSDGTSFGKKEKSFLSRFMTQLKHDRITEGEKFLAPNHNARSAFLGRETSLDPFPGTSPHSFLIMVILTWAVWVRGHAPNLAGVPGDFELPPAPQVWPYTVDLPPGRTLPHPQRVLPTGHNPVARAGKLNGLDLRG
jgi:hypothetical protein